MAEPHRSYAGGTFSRRTTIPVVRPSPSPTVRHRTDRRLSDRAHAQARRTMTPAADRRLSVKARLFLPQRPPDNGLNDLHPRAARLLMTSGHRNTEAPRSCFGGTAGNLPDTPERGPVGPSRFRSPVPPRVRGYAEPDAFCDVKGGIAECW